MVWKSDCSGRTILDAAQGHEHLIGVDEAKVFANIVSIDDVCDQQLYTRYLIS